MTAKEKLEVLFWYALLAIATLNLAAITFTGYDDWKGFGIAVGALVFFLVIDKSEEGR